MSDGRIVVLTNEQITLVLEILRDRSIEYAEDYKDYGMTQEEGQRTVEEIDRVIEKLNIGR